MHAFMVALVSDVFFDAEGERRLRARLAEARAGGAELALLPELPLNPWCPATTIVCDDDAEAPGGPRHRALAAAAHESGIGVVGGAIVRDAESGVRHNTALVFDARGELVGTYRKLHLPDEAGFREPCHYAPGNDPPDVITAFGFPFGVQICSDINRPEGALVLGAMGAAAILNPRATEVSTFERWKLVFRAVALSSTTFVLSVNRPREEQGVPLGGPSLAVDPEGQVLLESTDPVNVVPLDLRIVESARRRYPGYLAHRADVYARAWTALVEHTRA